MAMKTPPRHYNDAVELPNVPEENFGNFEAAKTPADEQLNVEPNLGKCAEEKGCDTTPKKQAHRKKNHRKLFEGTLDF